MRILGLGTLELTMFENRGFIKFIRFVSEKMAMYIGLIESLEIWHLQ